MVEVSPKEETYRVLSSYVGWFSILFSMPVWLAVLRLFVKSRRGTAAMSSKSNLMFLMIVAISSNSLYTLTSVLFTDIYEIKGNEYHMTTSCKVEGAIIQIALQSNAVSLLCITYEMYSALKLTNTFEDASIRFKRYLNALVFSLIIVLIYLGAVRIELDGRNFATGFSPSMNSDNYLKVPYSFCWIFFDMPHLYIVAYAPIITSILLSVVLLLKMRIVMLQRASDDVELKNRFMRIHRKLRGFPLITLVWWLPMLLYWLFAKGKHDANRGPFPIWIIMLHITFPSFVAAQSAVAYCTNDKIQSEVSIMFNELFCNCLQDRGRGSVVEERYNSGDLNVFKAPFLEEGDSDGSDIYLESNLDKDEDGRIYFQREDSNGETRS